MKRGCLLVAMLLLTACGGGSGGAVSGGGGGDGTAQANVTIVVNRHAAAAGAVARAIAAPTMARIAITSPNVNGVSYKQIQDIPVPGSTTLTIPVASGYTFELVTYVVDGTINRLIEYALTQNVQILKSPAVNTVTLTLDRIKMGLTVPASLTVAQPYSVFANFSTPNPLQSSWALSTQTTDYTLPQHLHAVVTSNHINMLPPVNNNQPATVYFQGEFFLKSTMINTNESYTNWSFVYPNPQWLTDTVSAPLLVPTGTVAITIP
jgi:hypothetical protein